MFARRIACWANSRRLPRRRASAQRTVARLRTDGVTQQDRYDWCLKMMFETLLAEPTPPRILLLIAALDK